MRGQRGAVLYVALVMLILLAMIGLVGMRVSGLQERMAANYMRANGAFQNAEGSARGIERAIADDPTGYSVDTADCTAAFNAIAWAEAVAGKGARYVRKMDGCSSGLESNAGSGEATNKRTSYPVYEITAVASDVDDASDIDASSTAVIQTVYWP
ncbi:MAG: PilX N-terminal domain-containing pilus assembly protein [Pseudoxanthomonas sp.]